MEVKIIVYQKIIKRKNTPHNPQTHHRIEEIETKFIREFKANLIPRKSEILMLSSSDVSVNPSYWVVENVIYPVDSTEVCCKIYLEVSPYNHICTFEKGVYKLNEEIPLVTELI